jgi:hypothetical protein
MKRASWFILVLFAVFGLFLPRSEKAVVVKSPASHSFIYKGHSYVSVLPQGITVEVGTYYNKWYLQSSTACLLVAHRAKLEFLSFGKRVIPRDIKCLEQGDWWRLEQVLEVQE